MPESTPPLMAFDTTMHTRTATRLSPEEARQAALVVCDRTGTPDDAEPVLELLGLIPPREDGPKNWSTVHSVVHGTESAVQRHRDEHTGLCEPCQRWVAVHDRGRAAKLAHRALEGD